MANLVAPFGLRPLRHKSGAYYTGACNLYLIGTGDSNNIGIGDPVVVNGGANTAAYFGNLPGSLPTVVRATAGKGNSITGVVIGFFAETAQSSVYRPASTQRGVFVADDPELIFTIQDDALATLSLANGVSQNAEINLSAASMSTATALSGATLNTNVSSVDATSQLKIMRAYPDLKNTVGIPGVVWEVRINNHTNVTGVAGV